MASEDQPHKPTTSVRVLEQVPEQRLKLTLLAGADGLDGKISSPRIQRLGLAFSGYVDYLHDGMVQLVGRTESNYLKTLSQDDRKAAIDRVFTRNLSCLIVTGNLKPPKALLENCNQFNVPIFQTDVLNHGTRRFDGSVRPGCAPSGSLGDRQKRVWVGLDPERTSIGE